MARRHQRESYCRRAEAVVAVGSRLAEWIKDASGFWDDPTNWSGGAIPGAGDVVEAVQALTGGFGVDVAIDAVGRPETWKQAFYARDLAGTVVLVGVPTPEMRLDMPLLDFFGRGGALKSSWYGDCLPSRDFPMLVDLHLQGRLPLEDFVTETIGLGDVEAAFAKMHDGDVLRSVVLL